jgi:hypothetical protein
MRDATETNVPLAQRSATRPAAARSSAVELRSFVDVAGTRPVSLAIAVGSVPEAPRARWAAVRRASARRVAARRAFARRALARRAAALCALARSAFARVAASAPDPAAAAVPVPVVVAGVLGVAVDGGAEVDGTVPEEGVCVGCVAPAPGAGSGAGAGAWGAGSGAGAAAAAAGQHAPARTHSRKRSARGTGAVERTARGLQGHGACCSRCFVLLELRVNCAT